MSKTVLVTGGLGFIGTNFILSYAAKYPEDTIIVVDKKTYAANIDNSPILTNYTVYPFDINDRIMMHGIFSEHKPEVVINFAAETHVDNSIINSDPFIYTNILGTKIIVDNCRKFGAKLIHISTDEVYGSIQQGYADENSPLVPSSPYSASKASADMLITSASHTYGDLKFNIIRPTNQYGPYQHKEKFIPKTIDYLRKGLAVPVYGLGDQKRNWMFVEDLAKRLVDIVNYHKNYPNCVINTPGSCEVDNLYVVKKLADILEVPCTVEFVKDRPGHDYRYAMRSISFPNGSLGLTQLTEGLKKTIEWYAKA